MAASQPASGKSSWKVPLSDWLAPIIAFVVVVVMLLALISVFSESVG